MTRRDLADASSSRGSISDHCATTRHVLDLMDRHVGDAAATAQTRYGDSVDRAKLLVVHAALLTHLHAKRVTASQSRQILDIYHDGAADEYTSYENFEAVVEIKRLVREAISRLEVADRQDTEITWFLGRSKKLS